ncbi:MAG: hypothetical protein HY304_03240 [candidate division Zixibacteria bacterium]|nr:hypothetical protein [candidate division Zixibacteria bacterium]
MCRDRISGVLATAALVVAALFIATFAVASDRGRFDVHRGTPIGGDERLPSPFAGASVVDDDGHRVSPMLRFAGARTISLGLSMAETEYDYQHNLSQGYQTGRAPGGTIVHFCYMEWPITSWPFDPSRFVFADWYDLAANNFTQPFNGAQISTDNVSRGGYTDLAMDKNGAVHIALHQRVDPSLPYTSWHAYCPTPGSGLHYDDELPSTPIISEVLWPQIAINRNSGWKAATNPDIAHVVSHGSNSDPRDRIVYWRYNGVTWEGPVAIDSNFQLGYVVAADANSDKVALVLHTDREPEFNGLLNVAYYESQTEAAGWINGNELERRPSDNSTGIVRILG